MSKLYVPTFDSNNCIYVYDKDTIRVFDSIPTINSEVDFTDYFVNSHYLSKKGSITFESIDQLPTCLSSNEITTDFYSRYDIDSILVVFFIILIVCIYFPIKMMSRMFGRWLKV